VGRRHFLRRRILSVPEAERHLGRALHLPLRSRIADGMTLGYTALLELCFSTLFFLINKKIFKILLKKNKMESKMKEYRRYNDDIC
jgi:hypothetical protein